MTFILPSRHSGWLALLLVACSPEPDDKIVPHDGATVSTSASSAASPEASNSTQPAATASQLAPSKPPPADLWGDKTRWEGSREEQNTLLLDQISYHHGIDDEQRRRIEALFAASEHIGQGNPDISRHAASPRACREQNESRGEDHRDADDERVCGGKYMAPLSDPGTQKKEDASSCIDKYEFPNIPCVYPVTWVRANEAVGLCQAMGKRLCDAHEWEDACEGRITSVEKNYNFGLRGRMKAADAVKAMRAQRLDLVIRDQRWAYGGKYRKGVCGTSSNKSKDCGVGWRKCGSNTFPAGFFPECVSPLGVYDQHGNAAEHMNLPLRPDQLASSPEQQYGHTEMKGSWFVFDIIKAHEDYCRWRAPYWHGTKVLNPNSHRNYHLGFRCCKSIAMR